MSVQTPTQSPPQPIVPIPDFVYNHDVIALANRLGRFVTELVRSDSANISFMSAADQNRLTSYLNALDSLRTHIVNVPLLDLPKTSHSVKWPVEPLDPVPAMNNEDVEDLVRVLSVAHAELLNSDSGSCASGLISWDALRLQAITEKAKNFLLNYVQKTSPVDMPASSPMDPTTPFAKPFPFNPQKPGV